MTSTEEGEGPPTLSADNAHLYNRNARGPAAAIWARVANEALAMGYDRPSAIREGNAAIRDGREHPRPKS